MLQFKQATSWYHTQVGLSFETSLVIKYLCLAVFLIHVFHKNFLLQAGHTQIMD